MPLLDSFKVDHTKMPIPAVRLARTIKTPKSDDISVLDLRFCVPSKDTISERGTHTLEHLLAGFTRDHLNSDLVEVTDISPMGCHTGFYMSLIGTSDGKGVTKAWEASMKDILNVGDQSRAPELNIYQYGTCAMHSLGETKEIAQKVLNSTIGIMSGEELELGGI